MLLHVVKFFSYVKFTKVQPEQIGTFENVQSI